MIKFVQGDIFKSKAQTLVNPVNCKGAMGKGLAFGFRMHWPDMYNAYKLACKQGIVRPGNPLLFEGSPQILSVPTKDDWRNPSTYEIVEAGINAIKENYQKWHITSLAIPALGCGLGGLSWNKVKPLIMELAVLPIDIEVYEP